MSNPRTYLFVPGNRPDRFAKAVAAGPGRVIIDLEDAVAPEAKDIARANITRWLACALPPVPVLVRINGATTPWHADDLDLLESPHLAGVMLPKAEDSGLLAGLRERLSATHELHALIETVTGVMRLREIAGTVGLTRLAFGSVDLANDAGIAGEDRELDYVRSQLVLESRYAGLPPPIDGVTTALNDDARLEADVQRARRFGFGAKLCLHPRQVPVVHRSLAPSEAERAWAHRVLAALADHPPGACSVDGKFVDQPVIDRAQAILAEPA